MRLSLVNEHLSVPSLNELILDQLAEQEFDKFLLEARGRNPVIDPLPTDAEIIRAIEKRHYVGFFYNEEVDIENVIVKPGFRLIEPVVFGKGYKWRNKVYHPERYYVRGYLIKSSRADRNEKLGKRVRRFSVSKTERTPYWRLFRLDRIHTWQEIKLKVPKKRNLYNPNDKMMGEILASAKF